MTVLVTGGLGFIGHRVVQQLEQRAHQVNIVDSQTNHGDGSPHQYQHILHGRQQQIRCPIYHTDITDLPELTSVFDAVRPKTIVHLASVPRQAEAQHHPQRAAQVMIQGLINLLELACCTPVNRFVLVSSSMVYGDFTDNVKETAQCRPRGLYGILKLTGESLVKDYADKHGFEYVIVRPSAVYGEHDMLDRVMAKFLLAAMRNQEVLVNGAQERLDFTHISDVATGIALASLSDRTVNKVYNVTRGHSRSLLEAANIVCSVVGQGKVRLLNRDETFPRRGTLDISAAKSDFGFAPLIDLEEGIQNYYHWLKDSFFWNP